MPHGGHQLSLYWEWQYLKRLDRGVRTSDTSKTYLLSRTLLLLFLLYTCVIWIQLTRTDAVFSRIVLVSTFCAENQLSGKIPENMPKILFHPKTPGARIRDGEEPWGGHTTCWRGPGQAVPGGGVGPPGTPSASLFAYKEPSDLKLRGVRRFSRRSSAPPPPPDSTKQHQKLHSGTLPGRGIGGDYRHHHHHRFSINHPCFPRKSTIRKNPGKYAKNPISPEDSRSQNTRRRRALGWPHHLLARARPGRARGWCGPPRHPLGLSLRL